MNLQRKLQKRTIGLSKGPKTLLDYPWAIKLIIFLSMIMKMDADPISSGKLIWKRSGPETMKAFLWATAYDRLMINENRKRGYQTDNPLCRNCPMVVENTLHVLRECPLARVVWKTILEQKDWMGFVNTELISRPAEGRPWSITFGVAVWYIYEKG
ncbi:hypothetical protein NC652_021315 [Populus alba x Populus x berolinensis]|nr:hypothetical protein NC652_021315 [Populus alba x Populus x berolinensis]